MNSREAYRRAVETHPHYKEVMNEIKNACSMGLFNVTLNMTIDKKIQDYLLSIGYIIISRNVDQQAIVNRIYWDDAL